MALIVTLAAAAGADARVVTERAARDGTRAELSYDRRGDEFNSSYRDFRLRIHESGELRFSGRLADCGKRCRRYAPAWFGSRPSVSVRDLNGGRPEVLVDFDTGGGYCCWTTVALWRAGDRYVRTSKNWGPKRPQLRDAGRGPSPEFISFDDRFLAPYGCSTCWRSLRHVWRFGRDGRFHDATRRFPGEVRPGSRALRRRYLRASRRDGDVKAPLAAYVATTYLLGEPRRGWRLVDRALGRGELDDRRGRYDFCPCGRGWVTRLERILERTGYR